MLKESEAIRSQAGDFASSLREEIMESMQRLGEAGKAPHLPKKK